MTTENWNRLPRIQNNFEDEYIQSLKTKYSLTLSPKAEEKCMEHSVKVKNGKMADTALLSAEYLHNGLLKDSIHEHQPRSLKKRMDANTSMDTISQSASYNNAYSQSKKRRLSDADSHLETMSLRKKRKLESITERLKAKSENRLKNNLNTHALRSAKSDVNMRKNCKIGFVKRDHEGEKVDRNSNFIRDHARTCTDASPNQINLKEFYSSSLKELSETSPFKGKMSAFEISLLKGKQSVERRKSLEAATLRSSPRLNANVAANQRSEKRSVRSLTPSLNEKSLAKRAAKHVHREKKVKKRLRERSKSMGAISPSSIENQLVMTQIKSNSKRRSLRNQQKQAADDSDKIKRHHSLRSNARSSKSPSTSMLPYRLNGSPKLKGLPAVLSLSTLSGIPQRIQGSSFSSAVPQSTHVGNISGTPPILPTITPAALLDDFSTYSHSVSRPSSLPIGHSGKPTFCDNDGEHICKRDNLEQHCNNKRQNSIGFDGTETELCSSREKSHVKSNGDSGSILAEGASVGEGRQSRRSSRSSTPSVTPIKMEVLTPSCTPCSTPSKSPSPSRNDFKLQKRNKRKNYLFAKYDDVLARWHDGLFYLGKILKIDEPNTKCLLRYEDNSEYWSLFKDIHRMVKEEEICCVCLGEQSEPPNEIVICDNCNQGFHQQCHIPSIDPHHVIDPDDEWFCRQCVFLMSVKMGGAIKEGGKAEDLRKMKQFLPYNLTSLTWDTQHKNNIEQKYCYCGGPGIWYQKMLQCCRCKQWFHEACMQCLEYPLLFGDSFFIFVCSPCNSGQEYMKRLDVDWADLIHIVLFNLALEKRRKYFDFTEEILTWIEENWNLLHTSEKQDFNKQKVEALLLNALKDNKSRFCNASEIRKKQSQWGLRMRVPPPRIQVNLPVSDMLTDDIMKRLKIKGRRSKVFIPLECKSPVRKICDSPSHSSIAGRNLNSQLSAKNDGTFAQVVHNDHTSLKLSRKHRISQPLLDKLIPNRAFRNYCHPFKTEIEQELDRDQMNLRQKIWDSYQNHMEEKSTTQTCDDTALEGPPVLEKVEPVIPECGNDSPPMPVIQDRKKKDKKEALQETEKEVKAGCRRSSRKLSNPPNILDTQSEKTGINVKQVKSADGNYFCAYDKLGFGQGFHILGRRVNGVGEVEYLIDWDF